MSHRFPMANKSFGQHFLSSSTVINKITSPLPEGIDAIVEIGPGPAVLTPYLAAYKKPIFVIEMDERFVELLTPVVGQENIYRQDALLFEWKAFLEKKDFKSIWLVSNLPYNVSVPLTLSFLRIPEITHLTLMYQKEVAQKILPNDSRNAMGSLHAMCFSQFHLKHVVYAPPGAFVPPPKVDSQVLSFTRRTSPLVPLQQIDDFEKFLRLVFSQKRKQLQGILKNDWGSHKTIKVLELSGISPEVRAEALRFEEIVKIFNEALAYIGK
jgi:16S rRNA (adenine1518-N6/adenine1519-N6)-dimethyltransferase